jgi:hypothetical protein
MRTGTITREKTKEPVWYLRGLPYYDYLQTDHWDLFKESYLRYRFGDATVNCERCGLKFIGQDWFTVHVSEEDAEAGNTYVEGEPPRPRQPRFNLHHLSYERLGQETFEDVILLCSPCHNVEHHPESHAAQYWVKHLSHLDPGSHSFIPYHGSEDGLSGSGLVVT